MRQGRLPAARQLLERQLAQTKARERGWGLLLRADLHLLDEEPELAQADLKLAQRAFGSDAAGGFACRSRELVRLMPTSDPRVPGLLAQLQRDYKAGFPARDRARYWQLRFSYEASRGNSRGAERLLEEALKLATDPQQRLNILNNQCSLAVYLKAWNRVDRLLEQAQSLWPQGAPPLATLELLSMQGLAAERRDQLTSARTVALAQLALARQVGIKRHQLAAWRLLQTIAERQGQTDAARRAWDAGVELTRTIRSPTQRAEALVALILPGYPLAPLERELAACWAKVPPADRFALKLTLAERLMSVDSRRGAQLIEEALTESRRAGDVEAQIQAHVQLARAAAVTGEDLAHYAQAYELRKSHPLADPGWARSLCRSDQVASYYASALLSAGLIQQAITVCRETCELPLSADNRAILLSTALQAAVSGSPSQVPWCVDQLEQVIPLTHPWTRPNVLKGFLATIPAGELTPARLSRYQQYYRELLESLERVGTPTEIVQARLGQATLLGRLGDPAAQLQSLQQARELAVSQQLSRSLSDVRRELLLFYTRNRRYNEALSVASELLADPQASFLHDYALQVGAVVHRTFLQQPREALEWMQRRNRLLRDQGHAARADEALIEIARVCEELKLVEQACAYLEQVRQSKLVSEDVRLRATAALGCARQDPDLVERALEAALRAASGTTLSDTAEAYIRLHPEKDMQTALRVLEHLEANPRLTLRDEGRTAVLVMMTTRLVSRGRVPEAVELWKRFPSAQAGSLLATSSTLREVPELQPFLGLAQGRAEGAERPLGALLDELRMARPELGNLLTLRSTNIAGLQARLGPQQLLVGYYPVGDSLYLVGLSSERTFHKRVEVSSSRLRQLVLEFQTQVRNPRDKVSSRSLSTLLVEPLEPWLEGRGELLVVPTGDVWRVPLVALQTQNGKYLADRVVVGELSSGDLLRLADGHYQPYKLGRSLAVGAPSGVELPGALRELQDVARLLPDCELRVGAAASSLEGGPWQLLHVATHASYAPNDAMHSYLQLAGQNLTLTQIHELKLAPGSLAVLSACESGLGQQHAGSEPVSLATAFSAAGAQAVISGLWTVDDDATALLFGSFYTALREGRPPGEALQLAQRATRERYPHPYYWAAFSLLGWPD